MYLLAIGILIGTGAIVWFLWHHSRWRGAVDTDRTNFKEFMREIRDKIDRIQEQIGQILNHLAANNENGQKTEQVVDVFAIELRDRLLEEVSLDPPS